MSFLILPNEIISNIFCNLYINDLIELYKSCKVINKYVYNYLKCNICNLKIQNKNDIYNFENCNECREIICQKCQSFCDNYKFCYNIYCIYCLVTETCDDCEEFFNNESNDENEY